MSRTVTLWKPCSANRCTAASSRRSRVSRSVSFAGDDFVDAAGLTRPALRTSVNVARPLFLSAVALAEAEGRRPNARRLVFAGLTSPALRCAIRAPRYGGPSECPLEEQHRYRHRHDREQRQVEQVPRDRFEPGVLQQQALEGV